MSLPVLDCGRVLITKSIELHATHYNMIQNNIAALCNTEYTHILQYFVLCRVENVRRRINFCLIHFLLCILVLAYHIVCFLPCCDKI